MIVLAFRTGVWLKKIAARFSANFLSVAGV
jgi:hypothetical protein